MYLAVAPLSTSEALLSNCLPDLHRLYACRRYRVGLISVMLLRQSHWSKHSRWTFSGEVSTRTMDEAACNWEHRPQMETCQGGKSNKLTRRSCGGSNKIVFLLCFITNVEFLVHEDGEHMMNDNEGYQAK
ncbi:ENTH domain [Musa troglodytarum]|uniref:ENTH domain n=1 Tax=Musa troglodytarum TaxID=320322 RepID=A0A9E7K4F4_9LILI|nr:ENTH domain [Musa troglodytarum]